MVARLRWPIRLEIRRRQAGRQAGRQARTHTHAHKRGTSKAFEITSSTHTRFSGRLCFILPKLPCISSARKAPPRQNQRTWEHRQMRDAGCHRRQPAYRRRRGCAHGCPPASAFRAARPESTCCAPRARGPLSSRAADAAGKPGLTRLSHPQSVLSL
jgi:hypothetical protein